MGQKIRPDSLRLGIVNDWHARWFAKKSFRTYLQEDVVIRAAVMKRIATAGVVNIKIERNSSNDCRVTIKAARPGLIIGRGGKGIEELTAFIEKALTTMRKKNNLAKGPHSKLKISIEDLKAQDIFSAVIAQNIALDLEKRMPFRRLLKKAIDTAMQNRDVKGIKVRVSGRLNGSEIARSESLSKGSLPLQTLRALIDYAEATAFTTYGTIGVKVWLYKGQVFEDNKPSKEKSGDSEK
ncbi:MAG: 30S ribosomal protein S3 [Candidatus Harrisonbacteria bacterium]|nr:30S ribosomal protein S3 [Candidatus Harrisonbacteria bacterium]